MVQEISYPCLTHPKADENQTGNKYQGVGVPGLQWRELVSKHASEVCWLHVR